MSISCCIRLTASSLLGGAVRFEILVVEIATRLTGLTVGIDTLRSSQSLVFFFENRTSTLV